MEARSEVDAKLVPNLLLGRIPKEVLSKTGRNSQQSASGLRSASPAMCRKERSGDRRSPPGLPDRIDVGFWQSHERP